MNRVGLLILVVSQMLAPAHAALAQGTPEPAVPKAVQELFDTMTPAERVGQLFLVNFTGTDTASTSQIYELIVNQHIGGVVLLAANDNFVAAPDTGAAARDLARRLQQVEWKTSLLPPIDPLTGRPLARAYVPLLLATIQDGDGPPGDQILSDLTPLPSPMALGATWSPELSGEVGTTMGRELASIGINTYLGPSLDVLENPSSTSSADLGAGVFGGDPFWVSLMGRAYVAGLHEGAQDRMLVIPKYFPGRGSSDRVGQEEVATVRKSLEALKQIELAPFFAVTQDPEDATGSADGLLLSHIRYQGFQGNIRATTKPVSFDGQALSSILGLPEFSAWREAGGLIVSDDLGTNAVRHFYSGAGEFSPSAVARDAFVAGNDLLYLGGIVEGDDQDGFSTSVDIMGFFRRKYQDDPGFAQLVDAAVLRVLTAKYGLYGRFDLVTVLRQPVAGPSDEESTSTTVDVATRSATLLSPSPQDLSTVLQAPPQLRDRVVFFTDSRPARQCSTCPEVPRLAVEALQDTIVSLYGPESANQTSSFRLSSYSFQDAAAYSAGESPPYLAQELSAAGWVVFSLVDNEEGQAQFISSFLAEQQEVMRDKRVILFAFGAPTYLDATDISRLTAYYALYSKQPASIEAAARLLFQEITPAGASPVSIPGLGYDLRTITAPDPEQLITLALDIPETTPPTDEATAEGTPVPLYRIGDTISIRTGTIKDRNGHQVPDGTVVVFSLELLGEGGSILQQEETITSGGVARVSFGLEKPGLLEIHASADPARMSQVIQLDVSSGGQPAAITVVVPSATPLGDITPPSTRAADGVYVTGSGILRFSAWISTVLLLGAAAAVIGFAGWRIAGRQWGVRWAMSTLAVGLIPYNYIALGLPGGPDFAAGAGLGGILAWSAIGAAVGWCAGWVWWRRSATE